MDTKSLDEILDAIRKDHDARSKQVADYRERIITLAIGSLTYQMISASGLTCLMDKGSIETAIEFARDVSNQNEYLREAVKSMGLQDILQEREIEIICKDRVPYFVNLFLTKIERSETSGEENVSDLLNPQKGFGFAP
ncbi:MAG: hypothetical protein OXF50_10645 [Caldilineaceae bacterium]|nr:hypothetical protein [Caldilineaceae bacterium]